jgi:hypothetical protein
METKDITIRETEEEVRTNKEAEDNMDDEKETGSQKSYIAAMITIVVGILLSLVGLASMATANKLANDLENTRELVWEDELTRNEIYEMAYKCFVQEPYNYVGEEVSIVGELKGWSDLEYYLMVSKADSMKIDKIEMGIWVRNINDIEIKEFEGKEVRITGKVNKIKRRDSLYYEYCVDIDKVDTFESILEEEWIDINIDEKIDKLQEWLVVNPSNYLGKQMMIEGTASTEDVKGKNVHFININVEGIDYKYEYYIGDSGLEKQFYVIDGGSAKISGFVDRYIEYGEQKHRINVYKIWGYGQGSVE